MRSAHSREVGPLTLPPDIFGVVDPAFAPVRDAFINNFVEHGEIGASVCITVQGKTVVDLWAGHADPGRTKPWIEDQLVNAFSIGKGITALLAAQCVDRGLLSYDTSVTALWPEFGVHGKEVLTFGDLLGHRAGLPALHARLPRFAMYDWRLMTETLAAEEPWWSPGERHGYHVNTFGYLVGEMMRRATGKSVGTLVSEWISEPMEADIYLGAHPSLHTIIAEFEWPGDPVSDDEPVGLSTDQLLQYNTYYNPSGLSGAGTVNTSQWRQAEIPSTNMHASARGVAKVYTILAHGGEHEGLRLLSSDVLAGATREVSNGDDVVLGRASRFSHGFQLPLPERGFGPNSGAFGHFGAGGSVGFCDPSSRVGFGYVMNQMGPRWQNPRNRALIESLYASL